MIISIQTSQHSRLHVFGFSCLEVNSFTKYMFPNIQESFHKVNNTMKAQAAIKIMKHTKIWVNKISYLQ